MGREKKKVLVVEDEVDLANQVKNVLAPLDLDITLAHSGKEAFEKLKSHNFNVVFTDIRLPEMDGLELLAEMRAIGLSIPVILVSGNADKEMAIKGLKLGAVDFIEKPFHAQDIVKAVTHALGKGEALFRNKLEALDLSQVQLKILEFVFKGVGNKDIATQVHLSEQGVKYHIGILFQRFNVKSRGDLKTHIRNITKE